MYVSHSLQWNAWKALGISELKNEEKPFHMR